MVNPGSITCDKCKITQVLITHDIRGSMVMAQASGFECYDRLVGGAVLRLNLCERCVAGLSEARDEAAAKFLSEIT